MYKEATTLTQIIKALKPYAERAKLPLFYTNAAGVQKFNRDTVRKLFHSGVLNKGMFTSRGTLLTPQQIVNSAVREPKQRLMKRVPGTWNDWRNTKRYNDMLKKALPTKNMSTSSNSLHTKVFDGEIQYGPQKLIFDAPRPNWGTIAHELGHGHNLYYTDLGGNATRAGWSETIPWADRRAAKHFNEFKATATGTKLLRDKQIDRKMLHNIMGNQRRALNTYRVSSLTQLPKQKPADINYTMRRINDMLQNRPSFIDDLKDGLYDF